MADFLIQATISNLAIATLIAVIAWWVQHRIRSASLANLLWALVLLKLITPPIFSVPFLQIPSVTKTGVAQTSEEPETHIHKDILRDEPIPDWTAVESTATVTTDAQDKAESTTNDMRFTPLLGTCWLAISVILLLVSSMRIFRFHLLLKQNHHISWDLTQKLSSKLAAKLGVRKTPNVVVTSANISPFVWWIGGRTVIVVSRQATEQLSEQDLRLIIAHEMAHIKRCDHWFRWLEWMALIGFWWNPIMWWAKTQLRISEEMACDHLVLQKTSPEAHLYANSLLNMAELLTLPAIRPPAVATAINSGGSLEKRLKMIIAEKTWNVPFALRMAVIAIATCVLPFGVVYAQDFEAVEKRLGGAVESGEISLEQANIMMQALREAARHEHEHEHEHHREHEAERNETLRRIAGALAEVGVQRDSMGPTIEIIRKVARDIQEKGNSFKLDKEIAVYLSDELNLSREQIGHVIEIAERLADSYEGDEDNREREMDSREREFKGVMNRIKAAVEKGEYSAEQAEEKIAELRARYFGNRRDNENESREMAAKKREYMGIVERIKVAVENGELSEEDAERKMIELRKEMFRDLGDDNNDREVDERKQRFMTIVERIKSAVDRGDLSYEEAEEKIDEVKEELFGHDHDDESDRSLESARRQVAAAMQKIREAIKNGDLSANEAEKQILELRKRFSNRVREAEDDDDREMEERKRKFMQIAERIKAAVNEGDLSKDEAEEKLAEIKEKLFGDDD